MGKTEGFREFPKKTSQERGEMALMTPFVADGA
jgi:hypothetical protein